MNNLYSSVMLVRNFACAVSVRLHFCMGVVVGVFICPFEQRSKCCSVVDRDFPACVGAAATPTRFSVSLFTLSKSAGL